MPTYQYSCTACGHFFEQVQSFSDASLTECPACQGKLRKVFNAVGVVFKGSGFYRNDSRSENGSTSPVAAGASKDGGGKDGKDGGSKDSGSKNGGSKDGGSKVNGSSGTGTASGTATTSSGGSSSNSSGSSKSGSAA